MGAGRQPERTCVGCRGKAPKPELARVVRRPDGVVEVDLLGRAPGRGAYVHPSEDCVTSAVRSGSLDRALRAPLEPGQTARLMREMAGAFGFRSTVEATRGSGEQR